MIVAAALGVPVLAVSTIPARTILDRAAMDRLTPIERAAVMLAHSDPSEADHAAVADLPQWARHQGEIMASRILLERVTARRRVATALRVAGELDGPTAALLLALPNRAHPATPAAITAAATAADWVTVTEEVGDALADLLATTITRWLDGPGPHDLASWRRMLAAVAPTIERHLTTVFLEELRARGFELEPEEARQMAAAATLAAVNGTDDIRRRYLDSRDDRGEDALVAALGLRTLLDRGHQALVGTSLVRAARDRFERAVFAAQRIVSGEGAGFTGRRRWTSDPAGRHGALNGVVVEAGEGWHLPERRFGDRVLEAKDVDYPRENPTDVAEWSGSTSRVEYEWVDRFGRSRWR